MLKVSQVTKSFSGAQIVRGCSLAVERGEIVGLIGPNGAGKSTLFNVVAGDIRCDGGSVYMDEQRLTGKRLFRVAQTGLVRTFQVPQLFEDLTVLENLLVAAPGQLGEEFLAVWLRPRAVRRREKDNVAVAWDVLGSLGLTAVAHSLASQLSGGQMKLVEIGRGLMAQPKMLLLDEPVAGVNPSLAVEIADVIRRLRGEGYTFLIIEHNMEFILNLADRVYVMANGAILRHGTPDEVSTSQDVIEAYLGAS